MDSYQIRPYHVPQAKRLSFSYLKSYCSLNFRNNHQISWFCCIPNGSYKEDNLKAGPRGNGGRLVRFWWNGGVVFHCLEFWLVGGGVFVGFSNGILMELSTNSIGLRLVVPLGCRWPV